VIVKSVLKPLIQGLVRRAVPVQFADPAALDPVSRFFGIDRGQPIDRAYIAAFLNSQKAVIVGRALEVAEVRYLGQFDGVRERHVLAAEPSAVKPAGADGIAVADLCDPRTLPEAAFDCFVCTQTLNFIFDVPSAVAGAHRLLKPGGAFVGTVSGIAQVSRYDADRWGDYWRFTEQSLRRLLSAAFGNDVLIEPFGNVGAAVALLQGLAVEDLQSPDLLTPVDRDYPVILGFRAIKC
jgi:SAM-dependent methyltransferase